eukprot:3635580-Amphidinium_carterae.1
MEWRPLPGRMPFKPFAFMQNVRTAVTGCMLLPGKCPARLLMITPQQATILNALMPLFNNSRAPTGQEVFQQTGCSEACTICSNPCHQVKCFSAVRLKDRKLAPH